MIYHRASQQWLRTLFGCFMFIIYCHGDLRIVPIDKYDCKKWSDAFHFEEFTLDDFIDATIIFYTFCNIVLIVFTLILFLF